MSQSIAKLDGILKQWRAKAYTDAEVFTLFMEIIEETNLDELMQAVPDVLRHKFVRWGRMLTEAYVSGEELICISSSPRVERSEDLPSKAAVAALGNWLTQHSHSWLAHVDSM